MIIVLIILTLLVIFFSGISTIPFAVGLLVICAVLFKKPWVFFLAFGLGLYLDLITVNVLGTMGLVLTVIVFLVRLYERKFEIKTATFVFIATFLGSVFYLWIFDYPMVFLQALVGTLLTVLVFKLLWLKLGRPLETL
jgi:hypothetical protein